jgi:phage-related protein
MGDTLVLDFQTNLLKTMEQVNTTLNSTNDLLTKNQKNLKQNDDQVVKMRDYYTDIEKKQKNINTLSEKFGKILSGVGRILGSIAGGLLSVFSVAGIIDMIKETIHYQQTFLDLSARMGQGTKAAGAFTGALHSIVQSTGISEERAEALIKTLGEFRISTKDIANLGVATARFAEITGMSDTMASRLTGELSRTGRVGAQGIKGVLFQMMNVQKVVGLTEGEMEELGDTVITDTKLLHQMGKTDSEIESFSKSTTMLVGAFAKVGLSVQDAQGILNKFLDPTQFEDSAFMFAKLGYSLGDVMNGAVPGPELAGRLKSLGQQVKGMGMAGVDMAKQLGMPYQTLKQMADLPVDDLAKALKDSGGDINKAMASAQASQTGLGKSLDHTKNRVMDAGEQLADKVMPALTSAAKALESVVAKITSNIDKFIKPALIIALIMAVAYVVYKVIESIRHRTVRASVDTSEVMRKGITGAMEMGSQKGSDLMKKNHQIASREMSEDYKKRVTESTGYSERMMKAQYFEMMKEFNSGSGAKATAQNTADWLKYISMGSKPTSLILATTKQHNQAIRDRLELTKRDNALIKNSIDFKVQYYKNELDGVNSVIAKLEQKANRTAQENQALRELTAEQDKYNKQIDKLNEQNDKFGIKAQRREQSQMNKLSVEQLITMKEQSKEIQQQLTADVNSASEKRKTLFTEKEALKLAQTQNKSQIDILNKKRAENTLGEGEIQQLLEAIKLQKQLDVEVERANNEYSEQLDKQREIRDALMKQSEEEKKLTNTLANKQTKTEVSAKNPLFSIPNLVGSALRDAGSKISDAGARISNSLRTHVEAMKEHMNPKNIASGLAKGMGGMTKALGKLGGMAIAMMLIGPILQKIQPAIEQIMSLFEPLIKKLVPIFIKLLNAFMPLFIMLVNTVLPPLLDVLGFLLTVIGFLVKAISSMAKFFGGKGLGQELDKISGGMNDASKALHDTASDLRKNPIQNLTIKLPDTESGGGGGSITPSPNGSVAIPATYNASNGKFNKVADAMNKKADETKSAVQQIAEDVHATRTATETANNLSAMDMDQKKEYFRKNAGSISPAFAGVTLGKNNR